MSGIFAVHLLTYGPAVEGQGCRVVSASWYIFTARCYASAVLAMALCLSVCLSVRQSVRPSQVGVLLKRLDVGSNKQHHTIAQGL